MERCTITEVNYWALYNYLNKLLSAVQLPRANYWTLYNYLNKLLNPVQLPKQNDERCTIT